MHKPSMKSLDHKTVFHKTLLTNFAAAARKPQLKTNQPRITQELKKKKHHTIHTKKTSPSKKKKLENSQSLVRKKQTG